MNTKICSKCGLEKEINNFRKRGKYYRSECKDCEKIYKKQYNKKYRELHKEELKIKQKQHYEKNKQRILEHNRLYRQNRSQDLIDSEKESKRKWRENNKDKEKAYREKNKEILKQKQQEYYKNNKEMYVKKSKIYRENHKEEKRLQDKLYRETHRKELNKKVLERKNNDPVYKLKCSVRGVLKDSFRRKRLKKNMKGEKILGCTIEYFINYLIKTYENNYNEKWNWDYLKDVHVDHIIPLATANTEEEVIKLCHYTNLQLLKAKDNLDKKDSLEWELKQ